jgi:hypothetical protein
MRELSLHELDHVVGGAAEGQPEQPGFLQRTWQGVKDVTGGFVAGAYSGLREDQPWGDPSSQLSKLGGETGVMVTMGMGQRLRGLRRPR